MKKTLFLIAVLCCALAASVQAQDMDKALSGLATALAKKARDADKRKITVADFVDLQDSPNELGRLVAEELTLNLVMIKTNFSVLERANLKKILSEHKLTSTGLVDPENAKKLGQFAGVDALILGRIVSRGQKVTVTAKIITTDTAEIVGVAKAEFTSDDTIQKLISNSTETPKASSTDDTQEKEDKVKVSKILGDLRVDVKSLIVAQRSYLMTLDLVNLNPKKSLWVAINTDMGANPRGSITDEDGRTFVSDFREVSGVTITAEQQGQFYHATEIPRSNSLPVTIRFFSRSGSAATVGSCRFQMEFLTGYNFNGNYAVAKVNNFVAKVKAD
jgi:TolB-like protein